MGKEILGKYYSESGITTTSADYDIMAAFKTTLGIPAKNALVAKKLTLISSGSAAITVNVNNVGYSSLYINSDSEQVLVLDAYDVLVTSLKIAENSASSISLAIVF